MLARAGSGSHGAAGGGGGGPGPMGRGYLVAIFQPEALDAATPLRSLVVLYTAASAPQMENNDETLTTADAAPMACCPDTLVLSCKSQLS